MSGQRRWIKVWARTVGMPVGLTDDDKPEFLPIKQTDVTKALAFRTFWIVLHVVTCLMIVAGNGRTMGWWQTNSNRQLTFSHNSLDKQQCMFL